jgi:hypothetical protein
VDSNVIGLCRLDYTTATVDTPLYMAQDIETQDIETQYSKTYPVAMTAMSLCNYCTCYYITSLCLDYRDRANPAL